MVATVTWPGFGFVAQRVLAEAEDASLVLGNVVQLAGQLRQPPGRILLAQLGQQHGQAMGQRQIGRLGKEIIAQGQQQLIDRQDRGRGPRLQIVPKRQHDFAEAVRPHPAN